MESDDEDPPMLVMETESNEVSEKIIPVTILTGFLGAGKTTLLNYILSANHGYRIAVIENEFSAGLGIEGMIAKSGLSNEKIEGFFELNNGCICCSVKDDLVQTLEQLVRHKDRFDYILIETTGVANPGPIINTFWMDDELGSNLKLDGVVAVIDCRNLGKYLRTDTTAADVRMQIAYADRILLNKTDLVPSSTELDDIETSVAEMNPLAPRMRVTHGRVGEENMKWLLHTDSFSMDHVTALFGSSSSASHARGVAAAGGGIQCLPSSGGEDVLTALLSAQQRGTQGTAAASRTHSAMVLNTEFFTTTKQMDLAKLKVFLDYILYSKENARADEYAVMGGGSKSGFAHGVVAETVDPTAAQAQSIVNQTRPQIYRMKGMLHISGETNMFTLQACHDIFDLDDSGYAAGSPADTSNGQSRVIVIGLNLDAKEIREGLESCCLD